MPGEEKSLVTRFSMEVGTAVFTGLFGGLICYGSFEFGTGWGDAGPEPGYFPFYVGLIIIVASVINMATAFVHRQRERGESFLSMEQGRRILSFFGPMLFFVLIASWLGIYVGMILYLFSVMVFQGGYRIPKAAAVSLATAVITWLLFETWFQVPLLKGPVEALLELH